MLGVQLLPPIRHFELPPRELVVMHVKVEVMLPLKLGMYASI